MKFLITFIMMVSFAPILALGSETLKGAKADMEKAKQELKQKLSEVEADLASLKEKGKAKSSETQLKASKEFEENRDKLKHKIDDLQEDAKSDWTKVKNDLADSIDKLSKKVQKALKD